LLTTHLNPASNGDTMEEPLQSIEELNQWLHEHNLAGLWAGGTHGDRPLTPHLWHWADIKEGLAAATQLVPIDSGGRRTINVRHPQFPDRMTNSIHMSVQCVLPGEIATGHRHNVAAMRFIIKGSPKAFTVVDGEPMPMETGDLITTPAWTWHDHHNESDEPIIWLDGLDVRMVAGTWGMQQEELEERRQPVTKATGYSQHVFGHARPRWLMEEAASGVAKAPPNTAPMRYRWQDTASTLATLQASEQPGDPYDGIKLAFTHPLTGGATLPTFACELQLLGPREKLQAHRHFSTSIYYVVRGNGVTVVDGHSLAWGEGDIFLVPPWATHHHENQASEDALLFAMDDAPVAQAIGVYREEPASA
jgi:1-hydroxy-2-naphthoate dioxygenase